MARAWTASTKGEGWRSVKRISFDGSVDSVARAVGASMSNGVFNADLSFTIRKVAEQAPAVLEAQMTVATEAGMVAEAMNLDLDAAEQRLEQAARRAAISVEQFARGLVKLRD